MIPAPKRNRITERLRQLCLALPETTERLSHGAPTFFIRGKRAFLMVLTNHHGDGRFAIWCAAPDDMQKSLVDADPERFFVPPYVGHRGWPGSGSTGSSIGPSWPGSSRTPMPTWPRRSWSSR